MASRGAIDQLKEFTLEGVEPVGKVLGRGAYGKVFTVKHLGLVCAAKEIHALLLDVSPQEKNVIKDGFIKECIRCNAIRHPNIVQFLGVYYPSAQSELPIMVMELMDTSLDSFVDNNKSKISLKTKFSILHDVSLGLNHLHGRKPPVIHRDLSSNNVLLSSHLVAKISDLGMAKIIRTDSKQKKSRLTTAPGNLHFMPPETLDETNPVYDTSVDVFSFAGISLHVFSEEWPSPANAVKKDPKTKMLVALSESQRRQVYLDKMTGGTAVLKPLIERCLKNEPVERPLTEEVVKVIEALKHTASVDVKPSKKTVIPPPVAPRPKSHKSFLPPDKGKEQEPYLLVKAMQTKQYHLKWDKCADLPIRTYDASVAVDGNNVYVTAGAATEDDMYNNVYQYNVITDQWSPLPRPGHKMGILCMMDNNLSIFGGDDPINNNRINKVSTYNKDTNSWTLCYPNMIQKRFKPGVVIHHDHVIVMGGLYEKGKKSLDSIELMNWQQKSPWREVSIKLPVPMWNFKPTIAGGHLLIVGYEQEGTRYSTSYRLLVAMITSLKKPLSILNQWEELPLASHWGTSTVPYSNPPLIIGGCDRSGRVPTSHIRLYDPSMKSSKQVDFLTSPRTRAGVATIDSNTIVVVGGTSGGVGVEENKATSLPIVEVGRIARKY
ncbi:uncharacterized protein [Dysidea avara]|uniref:uncharacterized protein isoform X2 n=1 Tax=Dysidea avara TaxID=196820 RepID=UPI0033169998